MSCGDPSWGCPQVAIEEYFNPKINPQRVTIFRITTENKIPDNEHVNTTIYQHTMPEHCFVMAHQPELSQYQGNVVYYGQW